MIIEVHASPNLCVLLQLNHLLEISKLEGSSDDSIRPPTGSYHLNTPVLTHIAAAAYTGTTPGLTAPGFSAQMDQTPGGAPLGAVSLTDFNDLRVKIATALTTLGTKIDTILNLSDLNCNIR